MSKSTLPPAPFLRSSSDLHIGKIFALFFNFFLKAPCSHLWVTAELIHKVLLHGSFAEVALWRTSGQDI